MKQGKFPNRIKTNITNTVHVNRKSSMQYPLYLDTLVTYQTDAQGSAQDNVSGG